MYWRKFNGELIQDPIEQVVEHAILEEKNLGNHIKICIGTDSQVKGHDTEFATVIVFRRRKSGGFMYVQSERTRINYSLKERMMMEVTKSIEIAYSLCNMLTTHGVELEIHADINQDNVFKSYEALKEATGYITGMGFAFKAKPDAFASSCCADKMVQ